MKIFYDNDKCVIVRHKQSDRTVKRATYPSLKFLIVDDTMVYTYDEATELDTLPDNVPLLKSCAAMTARENRDVRQAGTFPFNGASYDADQGSREKIAAASLLATQAAMMQQPFSIAWTDAANTAHTFDGMQMMQLGQAAAVHVQTEHAMYQAVKAQINATTTVDEVLAITEALVW